MRRDFRGVSVICGVLAGAVTGHACANRAESRPPAAVERQEDELGRIRAAVERALVSPPPGGYAAVPTGVRLLSLRREDGGAVVMDFSAELLAEGTGRVLEDALHQIFMAASSARAPAAGRTDDYRVLVNGVTLESHLP